MNLILDILITGLIFGGIYALIAMGLSLQYGVAKVLNIAHGEFIMLGALTTFTLFTVVKIDPIVTMLISGPIIFIIGFALHRTLFKYLKDKSPSPVVFESNALLASFGLQIILVNIGLIAWTGNIHPYTRTYIQGNLFGFEPNRLIALVFAVVFGVVFYLFLARTRLGKAIRAAAQDPDTAKLMGVNINFVLALCFGFGALLAGLAGVLISLYTPANATMGLQYTVIGLIVVVLGGLGSIPGSFIGGFILGIVGAIVIHFQPLLYLVAYYVIFMLLLIIRPKGLLGK